MTVQEVKHELMKLARIRPTPKKDLEKTLTDPLKFPRYVRGCSPEILKWFSEFNDILLENIKVFDQDRKVVLLTVCSYAKPYSNSFIHYGIRKVLFEAGLLDKVEYWHLSSAGVIPSCLEEEVPFCCYDWNNRDASESDLQVLREHLASYYAHWLEQYVIPLDKSVVTYFREESNTHRAIQPVRGHPAPVEHVRAKDWSFGTRQWELVTFNQRYLDPDCMLLDRANLRRLTQTLSEQLEG